jgi:thiamine-phosphate pyrophosphorylase
VTLALRDALRLVHIVDRRHARDWQRLDRLLEGGVSMVWLRDPGATGAELYRAAKDLARRCRERGVAFLVGDRSDVAMAVGADGVQLGARSPPTRRIRPWFQGWIGESCHDEPELKGAEAGGADFAVLSPVFGVPQKGEPLGLALFSRLRATVRLPVVGLGGIDAETAGPVRAAGADGVAAIRALRDAEDPLEAARLLAGPMTPR